MARLNRSWKTAREGAALATELHRNLEISHRQAKGLIDAGCVRVNGAEARNHGLRLKEGDEVAVAFDPDTSYQPLPRPTRAGDAPFELLWEDKDLLFVNKPAGLLTVPAEKGSEPSLADAITEHYRRRGIKRVQLYIVHRLDRWTSGVLVFAKTPEALHGLKGIFEEHRLQRVYKAILAGELPENSGTLAGRIVESPKTLRMRVVQPRAGDAHPRGAKEAVTHYRVMERLPGHTVVEVKLETGRRNQIRVQFADRGYPLLGDQVYGQTSELLDRQALHAELLGFRHPVSGDPVSVSAPMPADMEAALKNLRLRHRLNRAEEGRTGEAGLFRPRATEERRQDRIRRSKRFQKPGAPPESREERKPAGRRPSGPRGPRQEARADRPASRTGKAPGRERPQDTEGNRPKGADRDRSKGPARGPATGPRPGRPMGPGPERPKGAGRGPGRDSRPSGPGRPFRNKDGEGAASGRPARPAKAGPGKARPGKARPGKARPAAHPKPRKSRS